MKKMFKFLLACCLLFMSMPMPVTAKENVETCTTSVMQFNASDVDSLEHFLTIKNGFYLTGYVEETSLAGHNAFYLNDPIRFAISANEGAVITSIEARVVSGGENYDCVDVSNGTKREKDKVEDQSVIHIDNINGEKITLRSSKPILINQIKINYYCHEWREATCQEPKTCAKCHITEGEALGHVWTLKDCNLPIYCSRCFITEGEPQDHEFAYQDLNYLQHQSVCVKCNKINTEIPTELHTFENHKCTVCGTIEYQRTTDGETLVYTNTAELPSYSYTGSLFTLTGGKANSDGVSISDNGKNLVISSIDSSRIIESIDVKVSTGLDNYSQLNISSGTKDLYDDILKVKEINASSITLSLADEGDMKIKHVVVRYYNFNEEEINHTFESFGNHLYRCTVCGLIVDESKKHPLEIQYANHFHHQYVCTDCGEAFEEELHNFENHKCTICDAVEYQKEINAETLDYNVTSPIVNYVQTGNHVTLTGTYANRDGISISKTDPDVVISVNDNSMLIESVEIRIGAYDYRYPTLTVSSGTKQELKDDVFTITDVNAYNLALSLSGSGFMRIKDVVVHYYTINEDELEHTYKKFKNSLLKCTKCGEIVDASMKHHLEFASDNLYHYYGCKDCDERFEEEFHSFKNFKCTKCSAVEYIREKKQELLEYTNDTYLFDYIHKGTDFTVTGGYSTVDGTHVRMEEPDYLVASNDRNTLIDSVQFEIASGAGKNYYDLVRTSSGTKQQLDGLTFTVTDVNAPTLALSFDEFGFIMVRNVNVTYYKINEEKIGHTFDTYVKNEDGTHSLKCSSCGKIGPTVIYIIVDQEHEFDKEIIHNDTPVSSNTGDNNQVMLVGALLVVSGGILVGSLVYKKKKENR